MQRHWPCWRLCRSLCSSLGWLQEGGRVRPSKLLARPLHAPGTGVWAGLEAPRCGATPPSWALTRPANGLLPLEDISCPSPHPGVLTGSQGSEEWSDICSAAQEGPRGHPEDPWATPNLVTVAPATHGPTRPVRTQLPIGAAWGTDEEQRPGGLLTSDPSFMLPHRQVS